MLRKTLQYIFDILTFLPVAYPPEAIDIRRYDARELRHFGGILRQFVHPGDGGHRAAAPARQKTGPRALPHTGRRRVNSKYDRGDNP